MKTIVFTMLITVLLSCTSQQKLDSKTETITTRPELINTKLSFDFTPGKAHNHPSLAIWVEDLEGNYIETLYVTQYYAKGNFGHGESEPGKWKNEPGNVRRPATLPYWSHKRNMKAADGLYAPSPETAVPDALSGATPKAGFTLKTGSKADTGKMFRVLAEVNQPWDSNDFWTNDKYPDDFNYKTSLQPALVYAVTVSPNDNGKLIYLNPIGHSHYSGKTGELFTDISTITTAREIFSKIAVKVE
ncbi:MAG: hypothetical protein AB7S72_06310 [Draconibacterium sp.]